MAKILFILLVLAGLASSVNFGASSKGITKSKLFVFNGFGTSSGEVVARDGDLVVRDYNDRISNMIKSFSKTDPSYSHSGVVLVENGQPFVYHMYKDEGDDKGSIRKDSLHVFYDQRHNNGFGVFRYNLSNSECGRLKATLLNWQKKKVQFDNQFALKTDDKMYCSEMVAKLLKAATGGRITFATTKPTDKERQLFFLLKNLPKNAPAEEAIIAIDNLYINPNCTELKRYSYRLM
jgi:hypothetical protein